MGRKIEMKKIEDNTRCQVTFSKRRTSLLRKAEEICICCDADVALVAFSPSGRLTKYCNKERVEILIERYVNIPADKRFSDKTNIQAKMEKLKQLSYLNSEAAKMEHLLKRLMFENF